MSIGEKIDNLTKVKKNLEKKLKIIADGRQIIEFDYVTPKQWREAKFGAAMADKKNSNSIKSFMQTQPTVDPSQTVEDADRQDLANDANAFFNYDSDIDENEELKRQQVLQPQNVSKKIALPESRQNGKIKEQKQKKVEEQKQK